MRALAPAALGGFVGLLAATATFLAGFPFDRYFGESVDAFGLAHMCEIDSDPIACLIVLGDPAMSPACRLMADAPTDSNIMACYGLDELDLSPVSVAEGR